MERKRTRGLTFDPATSARMKGIGHEDTAPEVALRRALFMRGLRFRKNHPPVAGLRTRADIAFRGPRIAVYMDGCFWHGCPEHATWPKRNERFWREKIEGNVARDRRVDASLVEAGWRVIRVWEHEDPEAAADRIENAVRGVPMVRDLLHPTDDG